MNSRLVLILLKAMLVCGCASSKMVDSPNQQMLVPESGKAQVIFMRPSSLGGAVQASLFDVTDDEIEFIGIVSSKKQISHMVTPGRRVFMVVSEAADFVEANLAAGKSYYVLVAPRLGAWKARFSLYPIRNSGPGDYQMNSDEFRKWQDRISFVENTPASIAWFEENKADIKSKQVEYWAVWQQKSDSDIAARTLNPDDGI